MEYSVCLFKQLLGIYISNGSIDGINCSSLCVHLNVSNWFTRTGYIFKLEKSLNLKIRSWMLRINNPFPQVETSETSDSIAGFLRTIVWVLHVQTNVSYLRLFNIKFKLDPFLRKKIDKKCHNTSDDCHSVLAGPYCQ